MGDGEKVRFSRDGDQFHYLYAARRCLALLSPTSGLVAISIEGPSKKERQSSIKKGEEIVDVGEYFGSEDISKAKLIRYTQPKHSTQTPNLPWQPSGLTKCLAGFSERYQAIKKIIGQSKTEKLVEFVFLTNRPIAQSLRDTVADISAGKKTKHSAVLVKLQNITGLKGKDLASFFRLFRFESDQDNYLIQRSTLAFETKHYLPGDDIDAPIQLKELITRKALSENLYNPSITKVDVLRALGTTEDRLFPAPSRIESSKGAIPRAQERELVQSVLHAKQPILIHAAAGVGKTIFSQRIALNLPKHSVVITYDCFANGGYRCAASPRHRHKDALVQIANELAIRGLCDPLIPSQNADNTDYLRAFLHRIHQSVVLIRSKAKDAILCLAIDAADNAEIAAREFSEAPSFVHDLLQFDEIHGLRIVAFCRPERRDILEVSASTTQLELEPFNRAETARFLKKKFPKASENDIGEFHRLTSSNPRLQATALSQKGSLQEILRRLGPNPMTVDEAIAGLLRTAIAHLKNQLGIAEQQQIDSICAALATLRPLIPIAVLATVTGVSASAIESFAIDFGRPLLISDGAVQFRDEPVESWFRKEFRPNSTQLSSFVNRLLPLAINNPYVASTIPQLLLEAGKLDDLITLALASSYLPDGNPVQKRDIELNRLQFALKASLRAKKYTSAAKLAMRAGEETAGDTRQQKLLQKNTDLAAVLLEQNNIQELVSKRVFGTGWIGSQHAYEAGILSPIEEFRGEARSRLRMAFEWLQNWSRLTNEDRQKEKIEYADIAEISMASLNISGAESCAFELGRWTNKEISFRAGQIIADRLVDHERYEELNALAAASKYNVSLFFAINKALRKVFRFPPKDQVHRALQMVLRLKVNITVSNYDLNETALEAIVALIESSIHYKLASAEMLADLLDRYLPQVPSYSLTSRHGGGRAPTLRAYAIRAMLRKTDLQLIDLARPELKKEMEAKKEHSRSRELSEFMQNIGALLPWYKLLASLVNEDSQIKNIDFAITKTLEESSTGQRESYQEASLISNEIAEVWFDILSSYSKSTDEDFKIFHKWIEGLSKPLFVPTLVSITRGAARHHRFAHYAHDLSSKAYVQTKDEREDAELKSETYISISRALVCLDCAEAGQYFDRAVEVVSKFGDEITDRWQAIVDLAHAAANPNSPNPKTAYEFARCSELTYKYVDRDKHFDWAGTLGGIANLCASSSFAIISRWRDRQFGRAPRLLSGLVHHLLSTNQMEPKLAVALIGYRAEWDFEKLLEIALPLISPNKDRERAFNWALRYIALQDPGSSVWKLLENISIKNDIASQNFKPEIAYAELQAASLKHSRDDQEIRTYSKHEHITQSDWDNIFFEINPHTVQGIADALVRFKNLPIPRYIELFFDQLFSRVNQGNAVDCIQALSNIAEFGLYDYRELLETLPESWRSRMSVKAALAKLADRIASRFCIEIVKSRYYQSLPIQTVSTITGVEEKDFIATVVNALAQRQENFDSGRLFTLVGLLSNQLTHNEALEALDFGLSMYGPSLDTKDGDGPWTENLLPPKDLGQAIAGYVWAGLASPIAKVRWESAHVVRGLGYINSINEISYLAQLAAKGLGEPFIDTHFYFYSFHAIQWLMIAFARVAKETPESVQLQAEFITSLALTSSHVLIRRFAAEAMLALSASGHFKFSKSIINQLESVNNTKLALKRTKKYGERNRHISPMQRSHDQNRFVFGYDFSRYWFESLGDCFAKTSSEVEVAAEEVIYDEWKSSENGHWERDARAKSGLFREMVTYHSHGSYPKIDDLNFYLSYHSMLTVAGKWLSTIHLHQDPETTENEFDYWLERHLLTRSDGYWLADRRDPFPLDWPDWKGQKQDETWRWSLCSADFDRILGLHSDKLTVWGYWVSCSGSYEETAHVRSVFVSPEKTPSLIRAFQTASSSFNYGIPGAGEDHEIERTDFKMSGWITDEGGGNGIDRFDPWAGDIKFPPPRPATYICEALDLHLDEKERDWRSKSPDVCGSLGVRVWGEYSDRDDQMGTEHGYRVQSSPEILINMIKSKGLDLIVQVELERQKRPARYESHKDEGIGYGSNYVRLFSFGADGKVRTLR